MNDQMTQEQDEASVADAARQIKVPPELQEAYDKIVLAGMKLMFDQRSHKLMLDALDGKGSMSDKLSRGIDGLMGLLRMKSNNTLPPQVIIPSSIALLIEAAEFLNEAGKPVSEKEVGEAITKTIQSILVKFGASPEAIGQLFEGGFDSQSAMQQARGEQPQEMPQAEPQGVIGKAMQQPMQEGAQ